MNINKQVLLVSVLAMPVQAQTVADTEEITVSASRVQRVLQEVGVSVDVLDSRQLEAFAAVPLTEALSQLKGLSLSNSGGPGKQSSVRIRGEEAYRTRVLVDGVEVSDTSSTQIQPQIEHYLTAGVERVEVLRGPQGMMYGADAGGVVNIITRRVEEGHAGNISINGGSDKSRQLHAGAAGRSKRFEYSLQLTDFSTEGFNASKLDSVAPDDDGYDNHTARINLGYQFNDSWQLDGGMHRIDSETEFDNCFGPGGPSHVCESEFLQENLQLRLGSESDSFSQQLSWQGSNTRRNTRGEGASVLDTEGVLNQLLYIGDLSVRAEGNLLFGLDYQQARLDESAQQYDREQQAVFAEWRDKLGSSYYYNIGIRRDDNDDFGIHNSYRLSMAYLLDWQEISLKLKASAGNGFRAPSLYELAYNRGPFASPPASLLALQEELSQGFDAGFELQLAETEIEAIYFSQTVSEAIEFDLSNFSGYLQRQGESQSQGLELSLRQTLTADLEIDINYTYNDTEDPRGQQRIRRPRQMANLVLSYRHPGQRLRMDLRWQYRAGISDEYFDASLFTNVRTQLDDYQTGSLYVSYELKESLSLFARGDNLFDQDYQEIFNYNVAGRNIIVGATFSF